MANLKQVLTYAQTFEINFPSGNDVPVTNPATAYPGTDVDVTNSYAAEINGTEVFRGDVTVTAATTLVLCNAIGIGNFQCCAYIKADAGNTDAITITYVEPIGPGSVDIAILAPGQALYLPFIAIGGQTELQGTAASGTQGVYVSASFN